MKVPALALPNQKNHSDINILHYDGSRETASSYFRSLGNTLHLHLMVDSDRQNPASPRLTWQKCIPEVVIFAATFIYGKDEYGRHTSAAVILNSKQLKKKLPTQISNALDQKTVRDLSHFLSSKEVEIKNKIDKGLNSGAEGGEIYLREDKHDASLVHLKKKTNAIGSSIVSLLFRGKLIILTILKHLFQRDEALQAKYRRFPSISEIFPVNSVGIVTARDRLTIRWSEQEAWDTVRAFSGMDSELAREAYELGKDAQDWKVEWAQKDLLNSGPSQEKIVPVSYRPFDTRHTYYTGRSRGFICRPRSEVMQHMLAGENLALMTPKRVEQVGSWQHAFISNTISGHVAVSLKTIDYIFPLYIYPTADRADLFAQLEPTERQPNLNPNLVVALEKAHGSESSPEEILHYIYAILHAPTYREKYTEFLRSDFPRVPFTADRELFAQLATIGKRLSDLHLLTSPELDPPACRFEGEGDAMVARTKAQGFYYAPDECRLYINKTHYFGPITPDVYAYRIGGYQVCDKWLKDRKERRLELDDIRTYCRMVTAIGITLEIQQELDILYNDTEKNLVTMPTE